MAYDFVAADNLTVTPDPYIGLDTESVVWSSSTISQGSQFKAVSVSCKFHAINPNADDGGVSPVGVQLQFVVENEDDNGGWEEIGRQNMPIVKLEQGAVRTILISPNFGLQEEGVDQHIQGLNGKIANVKSKFDEGAEGNLRVCLVAIDRSVSPPNPNAHPFTSVTFSVNGKRYDP